MHPFAKGVESNISTSRADDSHPMESNGGFNKNKHAFGHLPLLILVKTVMHIQSINNNFVCFSFGMK